MRLFYKDRRVKMLYEVYFNDSDRCTLAGHFDEPGSLEELEACVAVLEQAINCLSSGGLFKSAKLYRDGVFIQKFETPAEVERVRALPRKDVDRLIAEMKQK